MVVPEPPTTATLQGGSVNALDWVLRVLVALVFLYEGMDKFGSRRLWIRLFAQIGFGQWFRYATGVVEIMGAALLMVPRTTTVAVTMLGCTMIGAFLTHLFIVGIGPQSIVVGALFGLILAIGWRRRE
jgi:uncharacterized membrane protein YphA (DoxX/SURF4 family)